MVTIKPRWSARSRTSRCCQSPCMPLKRCFSCLMFISFFQPLARSGSSSGLLTLSVHEMGRAVWPRPWCHLQSQMMCLEVAGTWHRGHLSCGGAVRRSWADAIRSCCPVREVFERLCKMWRQMSGWLPEEAGSIWQRHWATGSLGLLCL